MEDIIKLKSRGKEENYLKKLPKPDDSESRTYVLKVSNPILRGGETEDGKKFIDPSGDPMIVEGCKVEEADAIVESLNFIEEYGGVITFE